MPLRNHFRAHRLAWYWRILRAAGENALHDNCFGIAKGVAYSGLLSFFPVITTLAALLVQARADEVSQTIATFLYEVVPPGSGSIVRQLFVVHGARPRYLLAAAVVLAAWAASGAIMSLMEGFRHAYRLSSGRPFWKERGMAILLVFAAVVPAWGASALIVFGARMERTISSLVSANHSPAFARFVLIAGQVLRYGIAFTTLVLVTALLYHLAPNRKQSIRFVFPGAILATLLWLLATSGFAWYVRHIANYNLLYGSIGASLALLVWMYVLAVVALFGCEFNAAAEKEIDGSTAPPG